MSNALSTYFEQEILSADPMKLVCLLYQGAITDVREARRQLQASNVSARCAAVTKACDILGELTQSLDLKQGGELAARLRQLYTYMLNRMVEANLQKRDEPLAEVLSLLCTLQEGWQEISKQQATTSRVYGNAFMAAQNLESASHSWSF